MRTRKTRQDSTFPEVRLGAGRLVKLARAALVHGEPEEMATREARLLAQARETGARDEARLLLALACCAWANDPLNDPFKREAALLAAIALSATAGPPQRTVSGIDEKLAQLTRCGSLDAHARDIACRLASGSTPRGIVERLEPLLERIHRGVAEPLRAS
jgi:hypothetical protein